MQFIYALHFPLLFPLKTLKDLLLLCTDYVKFALEDENFRHIDRVAIDSSLGSLLAYAFM